MHSNQNNFYKQFLVSVLLIWGGLSSAMAAEPVAMVTDLSGKVVLAGDARKPALSILSDIRQDAKIQLDKGAHAVVVYLKSGQEYELNGPAVVQFGSSQPDSISGAKPQLHGAALTKGGKEVRIKPVVVAQAAIVMRSIKHTSKIKLLNLSDTRTLEDHPAFSWQAPQPGLHYSFKLLDDVGKILFESKVEKSSLELPQQIQMKDSADYTWVVSASSPDGTEFSNAGDFGVASAELRKKVESLRPASDATLSERVAFSAWLEQMNLRDEARKYWKSISAERPDDKRLKVLAGE